MAWALSPLRSWLVWGGGEGRMLLLAPPHPVHQKPRPPHPDQTTCGQGGVCRWVGPSCLAWTPGSGRVACAPLPPGLPELNTFHLAPTLLTLGACLGPGSGRVLSTQASSARSVPAVSSTAELSTHPPPAASTSSLLQMAFALLSVACKTSWRRLVLSVR